MKATVTGLGIMFVAGIYRPSNKPLADFTQLITGLFEFTNIYLAIFSGNLNVGVMNHSNITRNFTDAFHQNYFLKHISSSSYVPPRVGNAK